jgi:hypothetical protein
MSHKDEYLSAIDRFLAAEDLPMVELAPSGSRPDLQEGART